MTSFYSIKELKQFGFKKIGEGCLVSRKASIYNPENSMTNPMVPDKYKNIES